MLTPLTFTRHRIFFHENVIFWSAEKRCKDIFFPTIHHLSRVILAATTVAFVFLGNSKLKFHCYTQREKQRLPRNRPGSDSCNLSRLLARKITTGIHSCKPASLKRPIDMIIKQTLKQELLLAFCRFVLDKGHDPENLLLFSCPTK